MIRRFLLLFLHLVFCYSLSAQNGREWQKELDRILSRYTDSALIPGAVLQVKKGPDILYRKAVGYATRFDSAGKRLKKPEKMTEGHLFDIASLSKVIATTTAIMWLADKGMLQPDDPVYKFIPAFYTGEKKKITIRHLLTHTSGMYEWYPLYYRSDRRETTYGLIASLPLKYPVGKERHYSDLGFIVLGQIIETLSGQSLANFTAEHIFRPLGMEQTLYRPKGKYRGPVAPTSFGNPYEYRMVHDSSLGFVFSEIRPDQWNGWRKHLLRGEVNDGNCWYACGGVNGAAGLFSTVDDLQQLLDMLLRPDTSPSEIPELISRKTRSLFLQQDSFQNGLGWMMDPANSFMKNAPEGSFGHTGFTGTSILVVPSRQLSVILLVNRQQRGLLPSRDYYNLNPLRRQLAETVLKAVN